MSKPDKPNNNFIDDLTILELAEKISGDCKADGFPITNDTAMITAAVTKLTQEVNAGVVTFPDGHQRDIGWLV